MPKTETLICHHSFATLLSRKCVTVEKCWTPALLSAGLWMYSNWFLWITAKIWVLGLYWLESLASFLQIYQVDSCVSCILTNQSGGFWLGRYVFRFLLGEGLYLNRLPSLFTKVFLASFAPWSSRCFHLPNCICVGSLQKPSSDTSNTKCFCGKISSKIQS